MDVVITLQDYKDIEIEDVANVDSSDPDFLLFTLNPEGERGKGYITLRRAPVIMMQVYEH